MLFRYTTAANVVVLYSLWQKSSEKKAKRGQRKIHKRRWLMTVDDCHACVLSENSSVFVVYFALTRSFKSFTYSAVTIVAVASV